jgi:hypothetical protein
LLKMRAIREHFGQLTHGGRPRAGGERIPGDSLHSGRPLQAGCRTLGELRQDRHGPKNPTARPRRESPSPDTARVTMDFARQLAEQRRKPVTTSLRAARK